VTLTGQGRNPNMLRAQYLEISKTVRQRGSKATAIGITYGESNNHVTDDVTFDVT